MKSIITLLCAFLTVVGVTHAAERSASAGATPDHPAHRVVFEMTSAEPAVWIGVLNNVDNLRKALGADTQVEIVVHGNGLAFLRATNTARMKQLAGTGVVFAACRNTMKRQRVSVEQLLPFITTVDSGIAEIVRRQEEGWADVKSGE